MHTSPGLALLEDMAHLSTMMVTKAVANDWDSLAQLESDMAALRDDLMRLEPLGTQLPSLDEPTLARKTVLILQMLDDAETVRTHVVPWMESARKLITACVKDRAVRNIYGAGSP